MKKLIIIAAILFAATAADAMSGRPKNMNILGSDDHQRSHNLTVPLDPDRPVHPVPEPATIILLGAGLVGLAAWARRKNLD